MIYIIFNIGLRICCFYNSYRHFTKCPIKQFADNSVGSYQLPSSIRRVNLDKWSKPNCPKQTTVPTTVRQVIWRSGRPSRNHVCSSYVSYAVCAAVSTPNNSVVRAFVLRKKNSTNKSLCRPGMCPHSERRLSGFERE